MYNPTTNTTRASSALSTSTALHKQGAFDMDGKAIYRALLVTSLLIVIIGIWLTFRLLRHKSNGSRIRRYDILSAKQLVPDQIGSEDSDDELFGPLRRDDSNRRLVPESTPR